MNPSHSIALFFAAGIFLAGSMGHAVEESTDTAFEKAKELLREAYNSEERSSVFLRAEEALAKLDDVPKSVREEAEFFVVKGHILDLLEKPTEALTAFAKAEKMDPTDPRPVSKQGEVHLYQNRPEAALPFFERAAEMDPEDPDRQYTVAYTLDELGRFAEAEKAYRSVLDLDEKNRQAKRNLAGVLADLRRHKEALPIWQEFVEADDTDLTALWNLAQTWQLLENHKAAEREFLAYQEKDPEYWRGLEKLCQVSEALGKLEQRDGSIEKLYQLRQSPDIPPDLADKILFIRDQFMLGELKIYGVEYFELKGERAVKYSFTAYREPVGKERTFINKISLGSYETTTQIARELGVIGPDQRRFHLDMYPPDGSHYTLGFFDKNPGYDEVKKLAIEGFQDKLEPLSATIPGKPDKADSNSDPGKE